MILIVSQCNCNYPTQNPVQSEPHWRHFNLWTSQHDTIRIINFCQHFYAHLSLLLQMFLFFCASRVSAENLPGEYLSAENYLFCWQIHLLSVYWKHISNDINTVFWKHSIRYCNIVPWLCFESKLSKCNHCTIKLFIYRWW